MGIAKEGLGGNASAQQAGSPEPRILFNDGGFQTELAGTDGCHVTARPSSDDRDIERRLLLQRISLFRTVAAGYYPRRCCDCGVVGGHKTPPPKPQKNRRGPPWGRGPGFTL